MATGLIRFRTHLFYTNHSVKHFIIVTTFNEIDKKGLISVEESFPLNYYKKERVVEQKIIKKDFVRQHKLMVKKYDDFIKKEEEVLYVKK